MDYLRVLQVPFKPTCLIMIAIVAPLMAFFSVVGVYGSLGLMILNVWIFKYCYVLIRHLADGRAEPPVLDTEMLSPFEIRPWVQAFIIVVAGGLCWFIGGKAGIILGIIFMLLLPASIATLGFGERPWEAVNPLTLFRVIRGLGVHYLLLIGAMVASAVLSAFVASLHPFGIFQQATNLLLEVEFFALIGGALYMRRRQLGYEAAISPERTAAREEAERVKLRAKMLDDVFQQARMGKHIDSTRPLAEWLRDADGEYATRDALFVAEQSARWGIDAALNPIGSTLIRHLLRAGRPDSALAVFKLLRGQSRSFTMDSADDLRVLAEFAESQGDADLASSMRLETPIFHPRR